MCAGHVVTTSSSRTWCATWQRVRGVLVVVVMLLEVLLEVQLGVLGRVVVALRMRTRSNSHNDCSLVRSLISPAKSRRWCW